MAIYQTPGVYVEEISSLPPSVASVATALPAFIGFTEKKPKNSAFMRISSLMEYVEHYGRGAQYKADADTAYCKTGSTVQPLTTDAGFHMYNSVQLFFANGGGDCYIISAGQYGSDYPIELLKDVNKLKAGLDTAADIDEVTLLCLPDAVGLDFADYISLQQKALMKAEDTHDRFAILDIQNDNVAKFRDKIGMGSLMFGAAYTPQLQPVYTARISFMSALAQALETPNYEHFMNTNGMPLLKAKLQALRVIINDSIQLKVSGKKIATDDKVIRLEIEDPAAIYIRDEKNKWVLVSGTEIHTSTTLKAITLKDEYKDDDLNIIAKIQSLPEINPYAVSNTFLTINEEALIHLPKHSTQFVLVHQDAQQKKATQFITFDREGNSELNINKQGEGLISLAKYEYAEGDLLQVICKKHEAVSYPIGIEETTKDKALSVAKNADKIILHYEEDGHAKEAIFLKAEDGSWASDNEDISLNNSSLLLTFDKEKTEKKIGENILLTYYTTGSLPEDYFNTDEQISISKHIPEVETYRKQVAKRFYRQCPPSGAIAGIMATTDSNKGVWSAPANQSINGIKGLTRFINDNAQSTLNVDATAGKSINAIREFTGKGYMVWGARTLDGNSNEWRYVSVRRFYNYVEESIKKSTSWAVFQANNASTWAQLEGQISNFLTELWRQGALVGKTPDEAFFVHIGKNISMTEAEILEGKLVIKIGLATVRPAEFVILQFSHKVGQ